jgi:hypothetical protein
MPLKKEEIAMDVFISHITEESKVASTLKEWIESTFIGKCSVFVSSDSESIPAGTKWFDEITKAITKSKILILLCSPRSIYKPWINFEAGCGWIKELPVIPICYGGLTKNDLPPPISALQSLDFDEQLPEKLFRTLSKYLEIKRLPRINYNEMFSELDSAIEGVSVGSNIPAADKRTSILEEDELSDEEITILEYLAKEKGYVFLTAIVHNTKMNEQRIEYFLEKLSNAGYIHASYSMMEPTTYDLNHKGREALFNRRLI